MSDNRGRLLRDPSRRQSRERKPLQRRVAPTPGAATCDARCCREPVELCARVVTPVALSNIGIGRSRVNRSDASLFRRIPDARAALSSGVIGVGPDRPARCPRGRSGCRTTPDRGQAFSGYPERTAGARHRNLEVAGAVHALLAAGIPIHRVVADRLRADLVRRTVAGLRPDTGVSAPRLRRAPPVERRSRGVLVRRPGCDFGPAAANTERNFRELWREGRWATLRWWAARAYCVVRRRETG